jgi:hypothetical protein
MCLCRVRGDALGASSRRTDCDRSLSVLKLAQGRMALLGAQPVADALDKLRVRRPRKDNGTAHRGRPEKCEVVVVSKMW